MINKIIYSTLLVFCVTGLIAQDVLTNTRFEEVILSNGRSLKYAIHLPEDYDASKPYPAIIGPGDGVKEDSPSYYWHGTPSKYGWIIVESLAHFGSNGVSQTRQLIDHINANYNVEGDKFHMVGFSANSANSFNVGIALADRFYSLVGVAGFPRKNPSGADLERVKNTKFYFIVGDRDRYWMNASKKAHEYLLQQGVDSTIEIIKNGPHVLKQIDGQPFIDLMERMRK
ncbi:hypothetical protein BFP97_04545 [Roseivirga sp. 4D4]|uniref:hypothetical protein n=1 Tax=Roseivirga sp. 4D4 TaxID=1889784 RepID=UPI000852EB41|nr:hypothetical protein [Roseivirga sp. 4D4]OEK00822.1 hypothetical protein BFP97_04545 [Roseivirga sp. 4D4]